MFQLRPEATDNEIGALIATLSNMNVPDAPVPIVARDAKLREGNLDIVFQCDFVDEGSYWRWDSDPEHNRVRREVVAPLVAQVHRIQVRL
jgi:Stress responsive A/B Barrel Domain